MANVRVSVWHDISGEIVAIGRPMGDRRAVAVAGDGPGALEVEIAEEEIESLPRNYLVDASRRQLIRRASYGKTGD